MPSKRLRATATPYGSNPDGSLPTELHTILRLPTGIFYANGVKANVHFFDNRPASEDTATASPTSIIYPSPKSSRTALSKISRPASPASALWPRC